MDSSNLKEHLDLLKMKDIKNLIRQYNLHYKIKLSQNKPDLISDLLKHFEEYTINDNNITLKSKQYDFIKINEPKPTAPQKPRIKKDKKEDIKIKKDERMNTLIESLKSIKSKTKEDDAVIKRAQNEIEELKQKKELKRKKDESNRLHIKIIPPKIGQMFYDPNFSKRSKIEQLNIVLKTSQITGKQPNKQFYFDIADNFYKNLNVLLNRASYGSVGDFVNRYQLSTSNLEKIYKAKSSSDFFPTGFDMVKQIFDGHYSKNAYNMLEGTAGVGNVGYWAQQINPNLNITMNELDSNNYEIMKLFIKTDDNMKLMNKDFFKINNKKDEDEYDLIFLNPPFGSNANNNPQIWFMFLLKALHMLQHNKTLSEILFISPPMVSNRSDELTVFTSIIDLIKMDENHLHGVIPLSRWLKYVNEYDEKHIKSGAIFTKKDVIECKENESGQLSDYIYKYFSFNEAVSIPLKSRDFGGTKFGANYTNFTIYKYKN